MFYDYEHDESEREERFFTMEFEALGTAIYPLFSVISSAYLWGS